MTSLQQSRKRKGENGLVTGSKKGYNSGATIGNATKEGSYIPLIECIDGKYVVCEKAIEFLKKIKGPLAAVATVGKYRTGKSWLANRVLLNCEPGEGFSVGDTTRACTKGLLLATKVLKIKQIDGSVLRTLVIDTEGIGSLCANSNHDSRVFALAMLLSSYLMYNSMGPIDEAALENLSLVTNLTKEIRINKNTNNNTTNAELAGAPPPEMAIRNDSEMRKYFPSLLWILRDFSLKMVDESDGHDISPSEYLEQSLQDRHGGVAGNNTTVTATATITTTTNSDGKNLEDNNEPGVNDIERHKNRIRQTLRAYFPDRTCVQLPRPSNSENVDMADRSKLRPAFIEGIKRLQETIVRAIKPKLVDGKPISGPIFAKLCQNFVTAINSNSVPVVRDMWDMLSKDRCMEAYQEALESWDREEIKLNESLSTKLTSNGALSAKVTTIALQIKREYESRAVGEYANEYLTKLGMALEEKRKILMTKNQHETRNYLQKTVLTKLNMRIAAGDDLATIYELYTTECAGFLRLCAQQNNNNSNNNTTAEELRAKQEWMINFHDWSWDLALAQYKALSNRMAALEVDTSAKIVTQLKETSANLEAAKLEIEQLQQQLIQLQKDSDETQRDRSELQEALRKEKEDLIEMKMRLEGQVEQLKSKLTLIENEQIEERQQNARANETLQTQCNEQQEKIIEMQVETQRLMAENEKMNILSVEAEENRTRISELETDKASIQQDCDKLQADLTAVEEDFEQQLTKIRQESTDGMAELRDIQIRKQEQLQNQLVSLRQQTELEAVKLAKSHEQLLAKYKIEVEQVKKTHQELQRINEEQREEKMRLKEQLTTLQLQLQDNKKTNEITVEKLRDKHYEELRTLREQSTKELREYTDKEMVLSARCSGQEHKLESLEHKLSEAQKKLALEAAAKAADKPLILEHPRLKEKVIRLEMQLKSTTDAHNNSKQLLRAAGERISFLERQMRERDRKNEIANASAQLLLARQRFMEDGTTDSTNTNSNNTSSFSSTNSTTNTNTNDQLNNNTLPDDNDLSSNSLFKWARNDDSL